MKRQHTYMRMIFLPKKTNKHTKRRQSFSYSRYKYSSVQQAIRSILNKGMTSEIKQRQSTITIKGRTEWRSNLEIVIRNSSFFKYDKFYDDRTEEIITRDIYLYPIILHNQSFRACQYASICS